MRIFAYIQYSVYLFITLQEIIFHHLAGNRSYSYITFRYQIIICLRELLLLVQNQTFMLFWRKEEAFLVQNMMILKVVLRVDALIYNISVLRVFDTSKKIFLLKGPNAIRNSNMGSTIEVSRKECRVASLLRILHLLTILFLNQSRKVVQPVSLIIINIQLFDVNLLNLDHT